MSIRKKLFCLLSVITAVFTVSTITAYAANAQENFVTGDNSALLIIAIAAIAVAALVVVILLLTGNKKNKK